MRIKTHSGYVMGSKEKHLYLFKGVPYAKVKRFFPPEPYIWDDELDCTQFRYKAPQIKNNTIDLNGQSEDCLNLNIYSPDIQGSLPVLVEIHGGAFQTGSNQSMDPFHVIQNDQFIYVTINYRLGVLGYLYLGEKYPTSGNNGTLDQLMALEWIYNNIAFFGGDPNRITVLGSSAGAKAIGALMGIEKSNQLFSQSILISGAYQSIRDIHTALCITQRYLNILKVENIEDLEKIDLEQLLQAQQELCKGSGSTCIFGPVSDGVVIPKDFYQNFHHGKYWKGKAIIGSSQHEMVMFQMFDDQFIEHAEDICRGLFGKNASIAIQEAHELKNTLNENDAWIKVISDYMYRTYSYRMAEIMTTHGSTIYQYNTKLAPAMHTLDHILSLQSKTKLDNIYNGKENYHDVLQLSQIIRKSYINFVLYGDPKTDHWLPLNKKRVQMIWDIPHNVTEIELDICQRFDDAVFVL